MKISKKGELDGWKVGKWNGIEKNDWIGHFAHHTYILHYFYNPTTFNYNHSRTQNSRDAEHSSSIIDCAEP